MIYDLAHMAWEKGMRAETAIPTRGPTQTQEDDLYRILSPVVRHWQAAFTDLNPRMSLDAAPRETQIERLHLAGEGTVAAAIAALWRWIGQLDRWARTKWIAAVFSTTGIEIGGMAPTLARSKDLSASVEWAVSLIRDLNDDMRRRVQRVMIDAAARGLSHEQTARLLTKQARITRRRARLIARDQTQKIAAKMNELQQRAAGVESYVWQHSFLPNPRDHHVRRQGRVIRWDRPPPDGHPGHAINCRCTASALLRPQTRREAYL